MRRLHKSVGTKLRISAAAQEEPIVRTLRICKQPRAESSRGTQTLQVFSRAIRLQVLSVAWPRLLQSSDPILCDTSIEYAPID